MSRIYIQEVIEVEKTVSPKILFWLPNAFQRKTGLFFRWRTAGVVARGMGRKDHGLPSER